MREQEGRVLDLVAHLGRIGRVLRIEVSGASLEDIFIELTAGRAGGAVVSALSAIMYREGKIRATNLTFIFWDLFYPLGYLLVFGVGMTQAMGMKPLAIGVDYNAFFLAGVLGMASFGIASNTAWSFFMDRDNGIFFEMLTYPMRRAEYLLGKGLFNLFVSIAQAVITVVLADIVLGVPIRWTSLPLLAAAVFIGTAGWFFFYAIFALMIRAQRCVQHGDVGLLFHPPVRELDVLPRRTAADTAAAAFLGEPDHVARRCAALRHDRRRRPVEHLAGSRSISCFHGGRVWRGAFCAQAPVTDQRIQRACSCRRRSSSSRVFGQSSFSSFERARSASRRPSVWHVGQ